MSGGLGDLFLYVQQIPNRHTTTPVELNDTLKTAVCDGLDQLMRFKIYYICAASKCKLMNLQILEM